MIIARIAFFHTKIDLVLVDLLVMNGCCSTFDVVFHLVLGTTGSIPFVFDNIGNQNVVKVLVFGGESITSAKIHTVVECGIAVPVQRTRVHTCRRHS